MTRWMAALLLIAGTAAGQAKLGPCLMDGSDCAAGAGSGTVTSVGNGTISGLFTASWATATTTPALSLSMPVQAANYVLAGPTIGAAAAPTFRALVTADLGSYTLSPAFNALVAMPATDVPAIVSRRSAIGATANIHEFQAETNAVLSAVTSAGVFSGPVTALKSATTSVDVSAATAPSANQVLTATSSTAATWQTPASGVSGLNTGRITKAASSTTLADTDFTCTGGAIATIPGTDLSLTATAPAATTGASQAGKAVGITASPAVASTDTAGAAAGGSVTITAGLLPSTITKIDYTRSAGTLTVKLEYYQ